MSQSRDIVQYKRHGVAGVGVLRVAASVADAETVTIGGDIYEFDRAANGVTAGNIAVTGHADDTAGAATDALILAINSTTNGYLGAAKARVLAVDISANEIAVFTADVAGGAIVSVAASITVAETMAGANNAWEVGTAIDGGTTWGGASAATSRVPTAQEVALGNMHFGFPFTVRAFIVQVRVTASGLPIAWVGAAMATGRRIILDNAGDTDWAATDTVTVVAFE